MASRESRRLLLALAPTFVVMLAGCDALFDPSDAQVPENPGHVIVDIYDGSGQGVSGVQTCVEMPNNVGSLFKTCTATSRRGRAVFLFVPAGVRRVDVQPPPGFTTGPDGLVGEVTVVRHEDAHIEFQLIRDR